MPGKVSLSAFLAPSAIFSRRGTHFGLDLHRKNCGCEVAHAHQIVGGAGEGEDPIHLADATVPQLAHQRNRLQPPEALLDSLPLSLAQGITRVPRGAFIDGATATSFMVLGHMRRHLYIPALGHESLRVKALVSPHRHRLPAPGTFSNITSAASRSAVPLAWNTSAATISPLRFSTNKFPL